MSETEKQPSKWKRVPKMSFDTKNLSRRMKKAEGAAVKHARRFVFKRWHVFREVRRNIALWVLAIGVIIGAAGLQFMWHQQSYRTMAFGNDGTYAEAALGPIDTLNPLFAATSAEEAASELLFSRLLTYDKDGTLNYDLANSFTVSEDKKTYTVGIRPDARWHDGRYVRARDVVFTVNLLKNPATRSTISGWETITATEVNETTVAFKLPAVYAAFPHALRFLPILPEHELRGVDPSAVREHPFSTKPIGSGPFKLRFIQDLESEKNRKIIHMARNTDYYKGAPKLDRFQLHIYPQREAIAQALKISEVNAAADMSITDASAVDSKRYDIKGHPVNSGVYALLNTTSTLLQDKKVRQALQVGTDTNAVREAVSKKLPPLHLPFIDGQLSGETPAAPAYDVAAAGKLLDEAGWVLQGTERKKDGQPLKLAVVTTKNVDFEKALSELASQWRKLGITITTNIVDPSDQSQNVVQNILQPRRFDVLLHQLVIGADPDVYAYWHSSQANEGSNYSNYNSSISDEALVSARNRVEPDLRNAKYLTFARQWVSDAPAIGLYQAVAPYVSSKRVHVMPSEAIFRSSADRYSDVLYWSVGERAVFKTP